MPSVVDLLVSGRWVRLLHASPKSVHHRVRQHESTETLLTMFENTELTGRARTPDLVGYGDIHEAYLRTFPGKTLFNVGSVGNPPDLPLASYAVIEGVSGGGPAAPLALQLVRVPYDIERAVQDAVDADMPSLQAYTRELRTARYRGPEEFAAERERLRRSVGL